MVAVFPILCFSVLLSGSFASPENVAPRNILSGGPGSINKSPNQEHTPLTSMKSSSTVHYVPTSYLNQTSSTPTTTVDQTTNPSLNASMALSASTAFCKGDITYYGSAPSTIYITITEAYLTTISMPNPILTSILVTPPFACSTTTFDPCGAGIAKCFSHNGPGGQNTVEGGSAASSLPFISTVYITLKTPVTILSSSSQTLNFGSSTPEPSRNTKVMGSTTQLAGGQTTTRSNPEEGTTKTPPTTMSFAPADSPFSEPGIAHTSSANQGGERSMKTGSPSAKWSQSPKTPTDVPVSFMGSSAIIGGQLVPLTGIMSQSTLLVNGQTFTVNPSQVIAPGTTYAVNRDNIVTAEGLTFTVGTSQAVIAGTTYEIGQGAMPTSVVVGEQTLSIGTGGIGLASTTIAPQAATAAPALSAVTAGGLTFSVDASNAVISGTTYGLGSGASSTKVVVGGQTISLGSSGVGLASTTVAPLPTSSSAGTALASSGFIHILVASLASGGAALAWI